MKSCLCLWLFLRILAMCEDSSSLSLMRGRRVMSLSGGGLCRASVSSTAACPSSSPPSLPSSLSRFVMWLRDKVLLAAALRLCFPAGTEEWGKGELHFGVRYELHRALLLPNPPNPSRLPCSQVFYLPIFLSPRTSRDDHPCWETHLRGASPGPPGGRWETCFRTGTSSCLYFKAPVERDWDFCPSLAGGKVFSGSVHRMKDFIFPPSALF